MILESCIRQPYAVADFLNRFHYLGAVTRGIAWADEYGVIVLAKPTARRLPQDGTWMELVRWCLYPPQKNSGSRQWARCVRWIKQTFPKITTIVSYSDPSIGHTGTLYKASNWRWAPTWHRLRPPPTGNGSWGTSISRSVKDRWIYVLKRDSRRKEILTVKDASLQKRRAAPPAIS
jgi:hypothetical protein